MQPARQSSLSRHTATITIDGNDVDVNVFSEYSAGYAGSREEPPERAGYAVESVMLRGIDITDLVDTHRIEKEINAGEWE